MNSLLLRSWRISSLDLALGVGGGVSGSGDKGSGDGIVVEISRRPSLLERGWPDIVSTFVMYILVFFLGVVCFLFSVCLSQ